MAATFTVTQNKGIIMTQHITIARGDGIGPEIMDATLRILTAAGSDLVYDEIKIGQAVYEAGHTSGLEPEAWETLRCNKVLLKAPITTPQGGGYKSLNVTIRKTLGLYANVRPCVAYAPFVNTKQPSMDLVIVRENEEDLYAGIEHQQTPEVIQCLKLISVPGCEKIVRHAFEYARKNNRTKVTCMSKDNIMKQTDGLFHNVFNKIGEEYPDIEKEHYIIDIGTARIADNPSHFDVVVTLNLYGDIISDVAAEVAGSVGLAGSANIGDEFAMFEAIHGSAPDIADQNKANPSGLLLGAVMMLVHIGQPQVATTIHNAWLRTIEQGIHTADIYDIKTSKNLAGTAEFGDAVIDNLGEKPKKITPVHYESQPAITCHNQSNSSGLVGKNRELVGVDVFAYAQPHDKAELITNLQAGETDKFYLKLITNRGTKVWPGSFKETFCVDHWRCRFMQREGQPVTTADIAMLLAQLAECDVDAIKTDNLYNFDGVRGYSLAQGE